MEKSAVTKLNPGELIDLEKAPDQSVIVNALSKFYSSILNQPKVNEQESA